MTDSHAHPIDFAALGAVALAKLARIALVHGIALVLVLAGWCPSPAAAAQPAPAAPAPVAAVAPAPVTRDWAGRPLDRLTVAELRLQARAAGYKSLARNGRRAQLLAALA